MIAAPASARAADVVLYYDDLGDTADVPLLLNQFYNLLGHFTADIEVRGVADYHEGDLAHAGFAVYMGYAAVTLPDAFLSDVAGGLHRVLWVGRNADQLFDYAGHPGIGGGEYVEDDPLDEIVYGDRRVPRYGDRTYFTVEPGPNTMTYSYLSSSGEPSRQVAQLACDGNLCVSADNPFYGMGGVDARVCVFADFLHEFFWTGVASRPLAMVRLEDLAPGVSDLELLDEQSRWFESRGIPFSIGVVPVFRDPLGEYFDPETEFRLRDHPEFAETIDAMMDRGGALVVHGYTHQYDGVSREDWEFSMGPDNEPVPPDSADWARSRLEAALEELSYPGWTPRLWETPHYSASYGDYLVFGEFFDALYERPPVPTVPPGAPPIFGERLVGWAQTLPFESLTSSAGLPAVPENMGYIDVNDPLETPEYLIQTAETLSIVRDAVASFYFHHDSVDFDDVESVVDALENMGYEFIGPDRFLGPHDDRADDSKYDDDDDDDSADGGDDDAAGCGC